LWYAAGAKPVCMVLGLTTGGMLVSVGQFLAISVVMLRCGLGLGANFYN
jgi:hypothetical protein